MSSSQAVLRSIFPQSTGVIFAGRNGLDFLELRQGVVRIPEVSLRIREAQRILDGLDVERVDLLSALMSEDDAFFRNIKIKSLLAAVVQVGLYDRFLKTQRGPDVLVGNSNGDTALLVCAGQMTFEQLVTTSNALATLKPRESTDGATTGVVATATVTTLPGILPVSAIQAPLRSATESNVTALPSLTGLSLTEYRAFHRGEDGVFGEIGTPIMDLKKLLTEIVEHQRVSRFVNVGPGATITPTDCEQMAEAAETDEVTVIDSIDLDPMLNWFWKQMRPVVGYAQ